MIAGHKAYFDAKTIPSVAYTDPEIAWMGLTETQAQAEGREYEKAVFPWAASGRALATGRDDGMTKLLFDESAHNTLEEQLELEALLQTAATQTDDFREGVNAFLEKRDPKFTGS